MFQAVFLPIIRSSNRTYSILLAATASVGELALPVQCQLTHKMQRYTIFFTAVNVLYVSGGFSVHHQELKLYIQQCSANSPTLAVAASKLDIPDAECTV
jgi:hypothetical protein